MAKSAEEIKKEMAANSAAWHTADAATKKKLEAANQELGKQIGGSYNSASGTWSDSSGSALYTTPSSYTPTSSQTVSNLGNTSSSSGTKNNQYTQGNYTIGSDAGKQQAQSMGINTTWTATDGSVWTKEKDGTITVRHNGTETKGAYTPTDLGILGSQQVDAGLPYQDVEKTMNDRLSKIANNPELLQYEKDDAYWKMYNYIQEQKKKEEYENNLDGSNQGRPKYYQSKYDSQIDALLNEILNRDAFSYDVTNDPLYQQYANMYRREGDRAMKEAMAEAAAGAGGMNTYAMTAAQQANSYYNSQLNDKIPELYQLAYDMYLNDKESKVQDLGILQNMDASQYNRYRDTMADWKDDRNFAYDMYRDDVADSQWRTSFDYNAYINDRDFEYNDYWKNKEFDYNDYWANKNFEYNDYWTNKEWDDKQTDKELSNSRYEREKAEAEVWEAINMGVTPSLELIEKAEMKKEDVDNYVAAVQAKKKTIM